jgi:hypothetical protein
MDRPAGLPPLLGSFERHLRATNRADSTVATYLIAARQAEAFLRARCAVEHTSDVTLARRPGHVGGLVVFLGQATSRRRAGRWRGSGGGGLLMGLHEPR